MRSAAALWLWVGAAVVAAGLAVAVWVDRRGVPVKPHETKPIARSAAREPLPTSLVQPRIVIKKGERRLVLWSAGKPVRTYRVGLGFQPTGDKEREGDGRTPEGDFYICNRNAQSKYYLSLGLSYPNAEDAARGLAAGLITKSQHDRIVAAIERKEQPPWDTPLGGEVFIHGNGSSRDWTWGCVALDDPDIRELFDAVRVGTPVVIEP